jgi:peptidoglycan hydrolase-like protein with peptidoglycan-binding domain
MASWILVPCLVTLRNEFNQLSPSRDKASDGAVGDPRHAATASDHNPDETGSTPTKDADKVDEVHAIDVDKDLRKAGWDMNRCLQIIITRHRDGLDDRLQNVIYNRRIWSRSWGWTARAYTGSNAHTEHAHFSARYTTAQEADTKPWGIAAAAAVVTGKAGTPQPGSRVLKKGMSGPDVAFLRRWLGLPAGTTFDAALDKKLRAYQKMRGIAVDGIAGKATWTNVLGRAVKL